MGKQEIDFYIVTLYDERGHQLGQPQIAAGYSHRDSADKVSLCCVDLLKETTAKATLKAVKLIPETEGETFKVKEILDNVSEEYKKIYT